MARTQIVHSCGHEETHRLYGSRRDREWREKQLSDSPCDACYKAEQARKNAEAAQENAAAGLPPLQGTEKQTAWAETIRARLLTAVADFVAKLEDAQDPRVIEVVRRIQSQDSASWWIDRRGQDAHGLTHEIARQMEKEGFIPQTPSEREAEFQAEAEAKAEATVYPESPLTQTVAEVALVGDKLTVMFPEKRDDFRELIKKVLNYKWGDGRWERAISYRTGDPSDRIAETGHRLLAAGFPVRIFDAELRRRAIAGEFEPEHTRWLGKMISGEHAGWFSLGWGRDEDFYAAARKLPRSRYDKPFVVVPAEHFDEVLDFAGMHDFRLSPGAEELVDESSALKDKAIVADVKERPRPQPGKADLIPPDLDPENASQDIDDDLRDD